MSHTNHSPSPLQLLLDFSSSSLLSLSPSPPCLSLLKHLELGRSCSLHPASLSCLQPCIFQHIPQEQLGFAGTMLQSGLCPLQPLWLVLGSAGAPGTLPHCHAHPDWCHPRVRMCAQPPARWFMQGLHRTKPRPEPCSTPQDVPRTGQ